MSKNDLYEELKNTADIDCNIAKVEAATFYKKGNRLISNKLGDMIECVLESSKKYGKKVSFDFKAGKFESTQEQNIFKNYKLALEKFNNIFESNYKKILVAKMKLQTRLTEIEILQNYAAEQRDIEIKKPEYKMEKELQEKAKKAIDDVNYEALEKINKDLKETNKKNKALQFEKLAIKKEAQKEKILELLKECENRMADFSEKRRKALEIIVGNKENLIQNSTTKALTVFEEKNFFRKFVEKLIDRFLGEKRYNENVINVLTKKAKDINYKSVQVLNKKVNSETNALVKDVNILLKETNNQNLSGKYKIKGLNKNKYKECKVEKKPVLNNESDGRILTIANTQKNKRMWKISQLEQKVKGKIKKDKVKKTEEKEIA